MGADQEDEDPQGEPGIGSGPGDAEEPVLAAEPAAGSDPLRFSRWMQHSAAGAVLTGITIGLREALEPTRREVAFVIEAPSEPEDPDAPIALRFDPDDPTKTVAVVRQPPETPSTPRTSEIPDDGAPTA